MHRLTPFALALALTTVPLAPLYCAGDDKAAMACCAQRANECNRPEAPDDDCCRDAPGIGQTHSAKGAVEPAAVAPPPLAVVAGCLVPPVGLETSSAPHLAWLALTADHPPPPLSVLRL